MLGTRRSLTQIPCMGTGMHADCGHGMIIATSMAQLHMQVMTHMNCIYDQCTHATYLHLSRFSMPVGGIQR